MYLVEGKCGCFLRSLNIKILIVHSLFCLAVTSLHDNRPDASACLITLRVTEPQLTFYTLNAHCQHISCNKYIALLFQYAKLSHV